VEIYSFNGTLFGLEFEVRMSGEANQHYELNVPEIVIPAGWRQLDLPAPGKSTCR
jgi:hypothetical protein